MGTFEMKNDALSAGARDRDHEHDKDIDRDTGEVLGIEEVRGSFGRVRTECIVALKVYDQCRQQDCLTPSILGPARAAENKTIDGEKILEGEIITPPSRAAAVTIDHLRLKKVIIVKKEPNAFKQGFWDIDLKFVFIYRLTFREADSTLIGSIRANSIFNKKVTLFGSVGSDIVLASDILCQDSDTLDADPFVLVEGKAVALSAELKMQRRIGDEDDFCSCPDAVLVTIGLFSIIKLFRLVNLTVESRGFCIPDECEEVSPMNPCEFFDNLDFPFNIFSPPQKREFLDSIGDIGDRDRDKKNCHCD